MVSSYITSGDGLMLLDPFKPAGGIRYIYGGQLMLEITGCCLRLCPVVPGNSINNNSGEVAPQSIKGGTANGSTILSW